MVINQCKLCFFRLFDSPRTPKTLSTKYQKFLATNDHHDENNFELIARPTIPVPELSFLQTNNNNHINKPKPFPLFKQLHENLCKFI